jgi:hypothetical protein
MKTLAVLTAAFATLLAATVADARGRAVDPRRGANPHGWQQPPADCPLTISFGSYGPGIDRPTLVQVEQRLRTDGRVLDVSRHRWGREGEVTLCVRPRHSADVRRLARQLRAMIPTRPRGPVEVTIHRPR